MAAPQHREEVSLFKPPSCHQQCSKLQSSLPLVSLFRVIRLQQGFAYLFHYRLVFNTAFAIATISWPLTGTLLISAAPAIMCQSIQPTTKYVCQHTLDELPYTAPYAGCGGCGTVTRTSRLAATTKRVPCEDCQANGTWVLNGKKWVKA
jgi:hypothetical protein